MAPRSNTQPPARADLAEYYRELLEEQEDSGLSVAEFAEEAGVSAATLYSWRRRLRDGGTQPSGGQLVQVAVADSSEGSRPRPCTVTLRVGEDYEVELDEDFDADTLRRLLGVLGGC